MAGPVENPLGRLAECLRRLRAERELSVDALRARSGLGRTTVSQALNGRAVPSPGTVVALARALRADPEPLLDLLAQGSAAADTSKASTERAGSEVLARSAAELRFDERYLAYVRDRHANLTVFGLDLGRTQQARWSLDAAYLSLELAVHKERHPSRHVVDEDVERAPSVSVERAERALSGSARLVLRGHAGGGKTTLLQWLTVSAASGKVPDELASWRGRVPFLLPLRTLSRHGALPGPEGFLKGLECPLADAQPPGWADGVLASGRGAILVDGVDEVPQEQRAAAEQWLEGLVAAYPTTVFVVTTRPTAVPQGWLRSTGFTEVAVRPMSTADTALFVGRWHTAARLCAQDTAERRHLDELEASLRTSVRAQRDLAELATSPLMCAVICALHRERRGYLPHTRMELYAAALSMLLVRRDRERGVGAPESMDLSEQQSVLLLQRLAYWLIRNRQQEMDVATAVSVIDVALPSMPQIAEQGDAERVLEHLVARSGLLRRPTEDTIDFIHRTFQDYLGAKAVVEARDFPLLVDNARDDQWEDVIRMAVAHAGPTDGAKLLQRLIRRGDQRPKQRARTHLLAAAALRYATEIDSETRALVDDRTRALMPPRTYQDAYGLAALGPGVLDLLPATDAGLEEDEGTAVIHTAGIIGGDQAHAFLHRFAKTSQRPYPAFATHWERFDVDEYARDILALHAMGNLRIRSHAQREALRHIHSVTRVAFLGNFTVEEIFEHVSVENLLDLEISDTSLSDVSVLQNARVLTYLFLHGCSSIRDLDGLANLGLQELVIYNSPLECSFDFLVSLRKLRNLTLLTELPWRDLTELRASENLENLQVGFGPSISGVSRWQELRTFGTSTPVTRLHEWQELADLPNLGTLSMAGNFGNAIPCPRVKDLWLVSHEGRPADLNDVVSTFPGLTHLTLAGDQWVPDLTPLTGIEGIRIDASHVKSVIGANIFDEKQLLAPRSQRSK
ncbi:ATP-binding protein [Embleya hyalina]|uniref:ATP-binding protein n=1 Tax=Embleya hyalina TaxID=516124 RepID=A0A401YYR6_9ACTN|nr:ATP-binding protein [Embleya hyalina]